MTPNALFQPLQASYWPEPPTEGPTSPFPQHLPTVWEAQNSLLPLELLLILQSPTPLILTPRHSPTPQAL